MSTIVTRAGKGSPLTSTEVDANFTNLNSDKLQLSDLSAGAGISLSAGGAIANTAPDQTVALTAGGATSISGTYPNFTISSVNTTYSVGNGGLTQINFTSADHTKLDGIETGATADQNSAQILAKVPYLPATDDRDMKPSTSGIGSTIKGIKSFFSSLGGMTGTADSDYQDVIVLDTYSDTTGGKANALVLDKSTHVIKHYQAVQTATTWGTPKTLAYTDQYSVGDGELTEINFTSADHTKLNGIATGATADQTAAQILTAIKTVDGSGSGLDADLLDGQNSSYYAAQSNVETYIDRSYVSKHSNTNLAVGWYTIAQNTGNRAVARFALWDVNSSDHQSVIFYAAHHYGTDASNTLTVIDNSYYAGNPFRYIRIKDNGTYDGSALQVYIDDSSNSVNIAIVGDNVQTSGWDIVNFLPDSSAPSEISNWPSFTEKSKVDLNLIAQGGFATTGPIYADGDTTQYKVWSAGNDGSGSGLDADLLDGQHGAYYYPASNPNGYNNYSLPLATNTVRGGIELFSNTDQSVAANSVTTTASRTYGIQLNSANQAVVNVPWVNTTYSVGNGGLTQINFTSALSSKLGNIEASADVTDTTNVVAALSAGTGIGLSSGGAISNTAPDQTVALTGAGTTSVSGTYPNFTITGAGTTYTAGSGLSLTGTEFANTAPDQTVALTGAGATSISGTYPNFTISSVNTTYSVGDGGLTQINFTSADHTKLNGIAASANNYSLPLATNTVRGGIELFSNTDQSVAANSVTTTASRTYGIQLNSANQAVVNVPWVNTTYSVGNGGLTQINFTSADNTKLDGIEANATADQTGAQIKTAYEAETNAFTDAQFTKLGGIEASATADQTAAEIRALVESATNSNVFTDADHTKLNGIATGATNVTNNNQLTNGAGYTTNTGTVTPSSTDTFTNKSGNISQWTNNSGYTTNVGDITAVTAGTGLTGGGTTGAVTLNVIGGDGITANANDIALDSTVVRTTGTQTIAGQKTLTSLIIMDGANTGGYPTFRMTAGSNSVCSINFGDSADTDAGSIQYQNINDSLVFTTNAAERARITSTGDFLVAKTTNSASTVGCEIDASGIIYATCSLSGYQGINIRNNFSTDSLAGLKTFNGVAQITATSAYGGGHSIAMNGGQSGEYARFTSAKRLGIGITAPAEALHVVGNIVATGNVTANYSDERLKDFKGTIFNALDKVNQLNGYYYTPNETALALGVDYNGVEVGVSAQEVEAVLPEIVTKSAIGDDYKTVYYEKLTPLLIEAVKELTQKVAELESRLDKVEK
jgi:hypothetical protein|tara:strand:+ start:8946 stop:12776 length:3831 start_codon:yes stop_codon:yes gene_type:complete